MLSQPIIVYAAIIVSLMVKPIALKAETISIPVVLDYRQLQLLMVQDKFTGPNNTARYPLDEEGCASITFSDPKLSAEGELLRVDAKTLAAIGSPSTDGCTVITRWAGSTVVTGKPVLLSGEPLSVKFKVLAAQIYDEQGRLFADNLVMQAVKEKLHLLLSQYALDLKPPIDQLKALLPYFLPLYSADRLTRMFDTLRIGLLQVQPNGLDVRLTIDVETVAKEGPEPALSEGEMRQFEQRYRDWDAFLTFVIKETATATRSEELRAALLEILLDARYRFKFILNQPPERGSDPVKELFTQIWERLMPVMGQISVQSPEKNLPRFLSFITAADALDAMDRMGPAVGLDISTDGLRRLARLLNDDPSIDPLRYLNEFDPALQQLFGLGMPGEINQQEKSQDSNFQLIRPAYAAVPTDRLNRWVPKAAELNVYLPEVRNLLLGEANARIRSSSISEEHARVFRKIILTTAWQESCWRQYIVQNRRIVPLVSGSGDIGMLQINQKVWRGFYSPSKLSWDIIYNVRAGSEILFKFMVNYALKHQRHKQAGDLSDLARATYSAYNGGPSQVSRYRKTDVPTAQRKIDRAFWEKYKRVHKGEELAVAQCLGGEISGSGPAAPGSSQGRKKSGSNQAATTKKLKRIEDVRWIKERNPKHFTLQLGAVGSEQAVKDLIRQQRLPGSFAYFRRKQNGRNLYVAIYGSFANRAAAEKYVGHFAPLKPWIRDFGSIQAAMSK